MMSTSPHCYDIIHRGMYTLIFVLFFVRVDDNDSVSDVFSQLSHMPSDSAIPAGKVDTRSEEETGENCLYRPTNPRFRYPVDVTFRVLPARPRTVTYCAAVLLSNVMMLIVLALVAWSAARVASAIPVHVMRSAHESTTWNVTNYPISSSSAAMNSSYYNYSSEERFELPAEMKTILESLHTSRLQGLSEEQQHAMIEKLTPRFEAMNKEFNRLIHAKKEGKISEESFVLDWDKFVKSTYKDDLAIVSKVMFVTLASHFQGDDLPRLLVAGTKIATMKRVAFELLHLQINKWVEMKSDPAKVFELLQLDQMIGNPIKSTLFSKWVEFVELSFHYSPAEAYEHMLAVLAKHFEDDFALVKALLDGTKLRLMKVIAGKLLDFQAKKWVHDRKDEATVFELLELQKPNGNPFESPVFFQWVAFIEAKYPGNHDKKIEKMFDVLAKHFVGDHLTKILLVGAKSKLRKTKGLAQSLLDIQVQDWVYDATISDREGFDLLQLHETNGNPLESSVFPKWVNLVKERYSRYSDEAYEAMLDILADQFESTNALIGALVVGAETHGTKQVAQKLLEYQYKKWKEENKSADDVFEILELTESNLFSSPAFSAWIGFVSSRSSDDQEATKTMITTLEGVCKNGLGKALAEGTQIKRTKLIAENLQKALKEKLPESSKRQNDFGSDEPPAKRHEFDLSEALPESI